MTLNVAYLWECLWGSFLRVLNEERILNLNVVGAIQWTGVPYWIKKGKEGSQHVYCSRGSGTSDNKANKWAN